MTELERIATALERIANCLEKKQTTRSRKKQPPIQPELPTIAPISERPPGGANELIAAYCRAFKSRYGTNPPITGRTGGTAKRILASLPLEKATLLVQAYLQMADDWFLKRTHDFETFESNLGKVAVSLANGTQSPHEKRFWENVFKGEEDEQGVLPATASTDYKKLGRPSLQGGEGGDPLEGVRDELF